MLELPLVAAELAAGKDENESGDHARLVVLAATAPSGALHEVVDACLEDARGQAFLQFHEASGTTWLNKEAFEQLVRLLADREVVLGHLSMAFADRLVNELSRLAMKLGYRAEAIAEALRTWDGSS
jgi:hypothetical protein